MASDAFQPTPRSTVRRVKERGSHDRQLIYQILDEGLVCHVGFSVDGQPFVIPTAYARRDDHLILHGSVLSRMMRELASGVRACVTVTHVDGIVMARSAFHHSMNYRSVVALGTAVEITDREAKRQALDALVEHLVPGRLPDLRSSTRQEIDGTSVLQFPLEEVSAKVRTGPPHDPPKDLDLDVWAGIVPLELVPQPPEDAPDLRSGISTPDYARRYHRPRS